MDGPDVDSLLQSAAQVVKNGRQREVFELAARRRTHVEGNQIVNFRVVTR
jgi:hypothetical protein